MTGPNLQINLIAHVLPWVGSAYSCKFMAEELERNYERVYCVHLTILCRILQMHGKLLLLCVLYEWVNMLSPGAPTRMFLLPPEDSRRPSRLKMNLTAKIKQLNYKKWKKIINEWNTAIWSLIYFQSQPTACKTGLFTKVLNLR